MPTVEDANVIKSEFAASSPLSRPNSIPVGMIIENFSAQTISREDEMESPLASVTCKKIPRDEILEEPVELTPVKQQKNLDRNDSLVHKREDLAEKFPDVQVEDEADTSSFLEFDGHFSVFSETSASEDICHDLPQLPTYVEFTKEQQDSVRKVAISQIIDSNKHLYITDCTQIRLELIARLIAQVSFEINVQLYLQLLYS